MDNSRPCTPAADYRTGATRVDGWTPARQILFLRTLAQSGMVSVAASAAGMSLTSAYDLRHRPEGIAFALGWKAAIFLARDRLEDGLVEVANTAVETALSKGEAITRRRAVSGGLAMSVLNRLDRLANAHDNEEAATARAIAAAFAAFLDLITSGGGASEVAAFLARYPDPLPRARAQRQARAALDDIAASDFMAGDFMAGDVAAAGRAAGGRPEAAQVAQMRKLVENYALFPGDDGASEAPIARNRAQRRALLAKKRKSAMSRA